MATTKIWSPISLGNLQPISFGLITPFSSSSGGCSSGQSNAFIAVKSCGIRKDVSRLGEINFFPGILSCSFLPYIDETDSSLWVFWFYRYRRPIFCRDLIGKEKGRLEGTNIICFQWPGQTQAWLEALKADSAHGGSGHWQLSGHNRV